VLTVQFFTRRDCSLCDSAWAVLMRVQQTIPFTVEKIDIDSNPSYAERYGEIIPVITCNNVEIARSFVHEKVLVTVLSSLRQ
jgi:hypothetical protein